MLLLNTISASAQNVLKEQIQSVIKNTNAKVGVAVLTDSGESITVNDETSYAMLSTFKFPLALAVLNHMDKNNIPLDSALFVTQADLLPNTYSPLRDENPAGNIHIPLRKLLEYNIALSDNNACDILIRFLGGTAMIQQYVDRLGIRDMTITATEDDMHRLDNPYLNTTRPSAAVELLEKFMTRKLLSPVYQQFLEKTMIATSTGTDKIKGMLPESVVVGHKTGSSDRTKAGIKIADNDMGFVFLPDGRHFSIAVFVMESKETDRENAAVIARISKAVYNHFAGK